MDNAAMPPEPPAAVDGKAHTGQAAAQDAAGRSKPATRPVSRGVRLATLARTHALVLLAALSLFAAADSWYIVTGLGIASLLGIITAALAGVTVATLVHEWFHYLGARYAGAQFDIPARQGLFVYDWDFSSNSVRQFLIMSIAGSVGGFLSVVLLWNAVPADSWGRAVLRGAAVASIIYAALIEWPVIKRIRRGGDPLTELSKIDKTLLTRSFIIAGTAGIVITLLVIS